MTTVTARLGAVSATLLLATAGGVEARTVVKLDAAPLHEQASSASRVTMRLERGTEVEVHFRVVGESGAWCRVRSRTAPAGTGYVPCPVLEEQAAPSPPSVASAPSTEAAPDLRRPAALPVEPPGAFPSASPRPLDPAPPTERIDVWRLVNSALDPDPAFWAQRLQLTDLQRRRMVDLSGRMGWTDCRRQLRGVARGLAWDSERCRGSYTAFWRQFTSLLTPAQQARLEADEKSIEHFTGIRFRSLYQ